MAEDSLRLTARIYPAEKNHQRNNVTADISIFRSESADGPWDLVYTDRTKTDWVTAREITIPVTAPDEKMLFFRLDTKFRFRNRTEAEYTGPVAATMRPILRPGNMIELASLHTRNPIRDYYSKKRLAPALSPGGKVLMIANGPIHVFDVITGAETRYEEDGIHEIVQTSGYWHDEVVVFTGNGLGAIDIESLGSSQFIDGDAAFRKNDSIYIVIHDNTWISYNANTQQYRGVPVEFLPTNRSYDRPGTISRRPGRDTYISARISRFLDIWWEFDASFNPVRALTPINTGGLHFIAHTERYPSYYYSPPPPSIYTSPVTWIDESRLLITTNWSGGEEYWLYDIEAGTYRQVTGYRDDVFPQEEDRTSYYKLPAFNPVYNADHDRLMFFFPVNETRYAIRGVTVP